MVIFLILGIILFFLLLGVVIVSVYLVHFALDRPAERQNENHEKPKDSPAVAAGRADCEAAVRVWLTEITRVPLVLTASDGCRLAGEEIIVNPNGSRWAVLVHGYKGKRAEMYGYAMHYAELGFNLFLPDLRSHGESEGRFIGMGWYDHRDLAEWLAFLKARHPEAEYVLHGHSMGGATVLLTAGSGSVPAAVRCVVADCAYTSVWAMYSRKMKDWFHLPEFPFLPVANRIFLFRGGYDLRKVNVLAAVRRCKLPILFYHGLSDEFIPHEMTEQLSAAAASPHEMILVPEAGHVQSQFADAAHYYSVLADFLNKYIPTAK